MGPVRRSLFASALLALLTLASACGGAREPVHTTSAGSVRLNDPATDDAAAIADQDPHAWLFRVSGGDSAAPSYLLGTMHIGITFRDALPSPLDSALFDARTVAMEVDLREAQRYFREAPATPRPRRQRLDRLMTRESWQRLSTELAAVVPADFLAQLDPGFLTLYLQQVRMAEVEAVEDGRTPIAGAISSTRLDRSIFEWAIASGIPFVALETPEEAMGALAGLPSGDTVAALQQIVEEPEAARDEARRLRDAYRRLDGDAVLAIVSASSPELNAAMLDGRNQAWMPHLLPEIQAGNAFVAVGLAHLLGERSVVSLLEARGYVVERVLGDGGLVPTERGSVRVAHR